MPSLAPNCTNVTVLCVAMKYSHGSALSMSKHLLPKICDMQNCSVSQFTPTLATGYLFFGCIVLFLTHSLKQLSLHSFDSVSVCRRINSAGSRSSSTGTDGAFSG